MAKIISINQSNNSNRRTKRIQRQHKLFSTSNAMMKGNNDHWSPWTQRYIWRAVTTFVSIIIVICVVSTVVPRVLLAADGSAAASLALASSGGLFHNVSSMPDKLIANLDAILVLGGGPSSTLTEPPLYTQERCRDAAQVQKRYSQLQQKQTISKKSAATALPILCLSAGTAHVAQFLSPDGLPIWESTSSAAYLTQTLGVDPDSVYVETTSYDTIGNAYFTRASHTDVNGWHNLLIITSDFHMERSKAIFDWIFSVPASPGSAASIRKQHRHRKGGHFSATPYRLSYLSSTDVGLTKEALDARTSKEQASLVSVHKLEKEYVTLRDVYTFITKKHSLYNTQALVARGAREKAEVSDLVQQSYGGGGGGSGNK